MRAAACACASGTVPPARSRPAPAALPQAAPSSAPRAQSSPDRGMALQE